MKMPRLAFLLLLVSTFFLTACPAPSEPVPETKIRVFIANPSTITAGEETTLTWAVAGEDVTLTIDNGVGAVSGTSVNIAPDATSAYTLSAIGTNGTDSETVTVTVNPKLEPPTITSFEATPSTIFSGEQSTLSWTLTGDAATLTIDNRVGEVTGTEIEVSPTKTTEYTLTASNNAGSNSATLTVTVDPPLFIESTFDGTNKDGWAVNSATLENPGEGGSGGGDGNGYIKIPPLPSNSVASYYVAPLKYRTEWLNYDQLSFDLFSSGGDYFTGESPNRGDVFLANGSLTAQRLFTDRPAAEWESFVIPLSDDGGWILGGGATSLEQVLRRVTNFQIRAEYGMGADTSGLDNVRLVSND